MNVLGNDEIETILKNNHIRINGIFAKNMLPPSLQNSCGWTIVNMQSSTDGNGTHWIAFHNGGNKYPGSAGNRISLYFDSFGCPPPLEIENLLSKKYVRNEEQLQDIEESSCGYFCIAVISNCPDGDIISFEKFLKNFKNIESYFS